jgi:thiosulfate/3-mercaptopyruvate sulfurtransferase
MTSPLVSTGWLAERLEAPRLLMLDATWRMPADARDAKADYAAAHIPGACFFDIDAVSDHASALPHMLPAPPDFATAVRRLGVGPDSTVVVYDAIGIFSAPRAWWSFRAMGHDSVFVLDGGLPKWLAEGRPVETGWREAPHGAFKARARPALIADLARLRLAVDEGEAQIVDARPVDRFLGAAPEPRPGLKPGHMPGARNVPWSDLVAEDGTLAAPTRLSAAFEGAGVDLGAPIITTCGSGITASLAALALAALGRDDVAVYDGSWAEWGSLGDTPVAVGEAP